MVCKQLLENTFPQYAFFSFLNRMCMKLDCVVLGKDRCDVPFKLVFVPLSAAGTALGGT